MFAEDIFAVLAPYLQKFLLQNFSKLSIAKINSAEQSLHVFLSQ